MKITVIGESNIDIAVSTREGASNKAGSCQASHIVFHHGGVARNIAHNLCLLGHEVRLMTVFGGDHFAKNLIADCKNLGMDLSLSTQFIEAKSPIFLSINDKIGEMRMAYSDVDLNNRMDLDWVKEKATEINQSELVVANTLLTAEALSYLIDFCEVPLYIDSVSAGRALRLVEAMKQSEKKGFHALKCNLSETVALTGCSDPEEASKTLNENGIREVYVTLGADGALYCIDGKAKHFPALPVEVANVTGSGDAFLSGVIHANVVGVLGDEAVVFGLKAAQHNIKSEAPVNPTLQVETLS